ncbi:MAG: hypothetical protein WC119_01745 [Synergistaceae bacterium]
MSFREQYIEWEIPEEDVQVGVPIGFEVEFAQESVFFHKTYTLSTFKESHDFWASKFYYSLDGGNSWTPYPVGEQGKAFYNSFNMRLVINVNQASTLFALSGGTIYRIPADNSRIINSTSFDISGIRDTDYGLKSNSFYAVGDKTIYRIKTRPEFIPFDNSINVDGEGILAVAVDEERQSFWQVNHSSVCLKNLYGDEIFCMDLGVDIDVDYSSSSSSSSSSLSSLSSISSSSLSSSSSASSLGDSSSSSWKYSSSSSSLSSSSWKYSSSSSWKYSSSSSTSSSSSFKYSSMSSSTSSSTEHLPSSDSSMSSYDMWATGFIPSSMNGAWYYSGTGGCTPPFYPSADRYTSRNGLYTVCMNASGQYETNSWVKSSGASPYGGPYTNPAYPGEEAYMNY